MRIHIKRIGGPLLIAIFMSTALYLIVDRFPGFNEGKQATILETKKLPTPKPKIMDEERLHNLSEALLSAENYIMDHIPLKEALKESEMTDCEKYTNESLTQKKTYRSVWTSDSTLPDDITLVTVLGMDSFAAFEDLLTNWFAPISVCIYVGENDIHKLTNISHGHKELLRRKDIELSIVAGVFKHFPTNWMRQVALDQAKTNMVLLFDIGMIPSANMYENLLDERTNFKFNGTKKALIMPTFEVPYQGDIPLTKRELLISSKRNKLSPVLLDDWNPNKVATSFAKWKSARKSYATRIYPGSEFIILADRRVLPSYDIRFHGHFFNKLSLVCDMSKMNFQFWILTEDFVLYPHLRASMLAKHKEFKKCSRALLDNVCILLMSGKTQLRSPMSLQENLDGGAVPKVNKQKPQIRRLNGGTGQKANKLKPQVRPLPKREVDDKGTQTETLPKNEMDNKR